MSLKGKTVKAKATGITGMITGHDKYDLKVTFTNFQDISVPLEKAEALFEMDSETAEELRKLAGSSKTKKARKEPSKVQTYMDCDEEIDEDDETEEEETDDLIFEKPFEEEE